VQQPGVDIINTDKVEECREYFFNTEKIKRKYTQRATEDCCAMK
jgi:hypothetical protein